MIFQSFEDEFRVLKTLRVSIIGTLVGPNPENKDLLSDEIYTTYTNV